jgi:hypothetical protein
MSNHPASLSRDQHDSVSASWVELCLHYLPISIANSVWRYSREVLPGDQEQGWKLHVSATVLTAVRMLQLVAPLLTGRNVLYKAPASLDEVIKLNAGIFYGYSQVGKILTIYPETTADALRLAKELHHLTRRITAPAVPFDLKYRRDGCVYYRYGAFKAKGGDSLEGERAVALRDPQGNLVPDFRDSVGTPVWVTDPFQSQEDSSSIKPRRSRPVTPLETTFKAFRAIAQRGKGGVYLALDLSGASPRACILKEGRRHGEVGWDGRDGFWRVQHEGNVLDSLFAAGVNVPHLYSSFKAERNYYLAIEFIDGENLEEYLIRKTRRLGLSAALRLSIEVALMLSNIHNAGWVWRDCKPRNIIRTGRSTLRPIDFEGACPIDDSDPQPWGTNSYVPPEWDMELRGQSRLPEDLYAMGAIICLLLNGRPPDRESHSIARFRRNVPAGVSAIVAKLLDIDPKRRPAAHWVAQRLRAELNSILAARAPHPCSLSSAGPGKLPR